MQSTNDNLDSRGKVNKSELPNVQNSERIRKKKYYFIHTSVCLGVKKVINALVHALVLSHNLS